MSPSPVHRKIMSLLRPGYLVRVWLVTFFASPLLFFVALLIVHAAPQEDVVRALPIVLFLIVFGSLLLFPALLLYWVVWWALKYMPYGMRAKKGLLSAAGIAGTWLLYFLFDRQFFAEGGFGVYVWPASYSVVLTAATFYFPLAEQVVPPAAKNRTRVLSGKSRNRNKKA